MLLSSYQKVEGYLFDSINKFLWLMIVFFLYKDKLEPLSSESLENVLQQLPETDSIEQRSQEFSIIKENLANLKKRLGRLVRLLYF